MRISDWSSDVCSSDLRIWRPEDRSGATDEGPGEGEPAASPCDIGPDAGPADIAGGCPGKLLSPARRRRCIDHIRTMMPVSERRVCRVLGQHRSRPEARRVGNVCVSTSSSRWSQYHSKETIRKQESQKKITHT